MVLLRENYRELRAILAASAAESAAPETPLCVLVVCIRLLGRVSPRHMYASVMVMLCVWVERLERLGWRCVGIGGGFSEVF